MVDSKDGFILGGIVTPANEPDMKHMETVIQEGKISQVRYKVERIFGSLNRLYGLYRMR